MSERRAPLMAHLEELRGRIFKAALAIIVASIVAFIFRNWVFDILIAPYEAVAGDQKPYAETKPGDLGADCKIWRI